MNEFSTFFFPDKPNNNPEKSGLNFCGLELPKTCKVFKTLQNSSLKRDMPETRTALHTHTHTHTGKPYPLFLNFRSELPLLIYTSPPKIIGHIISFPIPSISTVRQLQAVKQPHFITIFLQTTPFKLLIIPLRLIIILLGLSIIPFGLPIIPLGLTIIPFGLLIIPLGLTIIPFGLLIIPFGLTIILLGLLIIPLGLNINNYEL